MKIFLELINEAVKSAVQKVSNIKELTCRQSELAKALGLTPSAISKLIKEKIVIRDEDDPTGGVMLVESLLNYQRQRGENQESVDYWNEKALHEKAKREMTELKLKKMDNELIDVMLVKKVIAEEYTKFRSRLMSIPTKLSAKLEGKTKEKIKEMLMSELEERLEELSELKVNAE